METEGEQSLLHWTQKLQRLIPEQRWRRAAGVALLALALVTGVSIGTRRRAMEAYVTADVVTIKSPIDGRVTIAPASAGVLVKAGKTLINIEATRMDSQLLSESRWNLQKAVAELSATSEALQRVSRTYQERMESDVEHARLELEELTVQKQRYEEQNQLYTDLALEGAIPRERQLEVAAMAKTFGIRVRQQENVLDDLEEELTAAHRSPSAAQNKRLHSARRMEVMEIELDQLLARHQTLERSVEHLKQQLKEAEQRSTFRYQPSFQGLLLTSRFNENDEVNEANVLLTLINCQKLRVEALFETNKLKNLRIGQSVIVRWPNDNVQEQGILTSMRGEQGINGLETSGIAKFRPAHVDRTRLMIALPKNSYASRRCRLGERVQVDL